MAPKYLLPKVIEIHRVGGPEAVLAWYKELSPEEAEQFRLELIEARDQISATMESIGTIIAGLIPVVQAFAESITRIFGEAGNVGWKDEDWPWEYPGKGSNDKPS